MTERFSHGPDGLWQDPDGLYVEYAELEAAESRCEELERAVKIEEADRLESKRAAIRHSKRCKELEEALRRLQTGPDTLTQDGLRIVLDALYPQGHEQEEEEVSTWDRLRDVMREQREAEVDYERKKSHLAAHLKLAVDDLAEEGHPIDEINERVGRIWLDVHKEGAGDE